MAFSHIVKDGDHLSKIAKRFGFRSFRTVWNDAGNALLRALRVNPNVLLPGDVVFIPDKQDRDEAVQTGRRHTFFTTTPSLRLRVVLKDRFDTPLGGEPCTLEIDGDARPVITSNDGVIERSIAVNAEGGQLSIVGVAVPVGIGRLHPVDDASGWLARLNNLGYHGGDTVNASTADLRSAVEEFQCDFGLPVVGLAADGALDGKTKQALLAAHGC